MLLTIRDLDQSDEKLAPFMEMAEQLSGIYYDFIKEDQNEAYKYEVNIFGGSSKERKPGIHASEISKCERIMVYSLMATDRIPNTTSVNINMLMRFRLGHAVHAMVQNDWHRIAKVDDNIQFADEVKIHPGLGGKAEEWELMSSCDGVVTILRGGIPQVRVGVEIKTESGPQYDKLKKVRPDHEEQTCLYMAALDLPLMWTFYYNKSNSNITNSHNPWLYTFNTKLWEDQLEMRFARAQHMAETKELPDRKEGMQCSWCAYGHTCKPKYLKSKMPTQISRGMGAKR